MSWVVTLSDGQNQKASDAPNCSTHRDSQGWCTMIGARPERWIVDGKFQQPNLYEFPVFQAGPRICLGMSFALLEAGVLLVRLVSGFDFELADPKAAISPDCTKLTMNIKGPLNMYVRPLCLVKERLYNTKYHR